MEKVFPEWVSGTEEGYKSIRDGLQVQMQMIQAIKELKQENDELRSRMNDLEELH